MSLATCGARRKSGVIGTLSEEKEPELICKICLFEYPTREMAKLQSCGCIFCKEVFQKKSVGIRVTFFT